MLAIAKHAHVKRPKAFLLKVLGSAMLKGSKARARRCPFKLDVGPLTVLYSWCWSCGQIAKGAARNIFLLRKLVSVLVAREGGRGLGRE